MKNLNLFVLTLLSIMLFVGCEKLEDVFGNEIDSIPKSGLYYEEDFADNLDAIYSDKGYIALFGFEEIQVTPAVANEERIIYIGKVENDEFVTDNAMVLIVDSTNFPVRMAMKDVNVIFSRNDEQHFNFAIYTSQSQEWKEYENIIYEYSDADKESPTRALASDGYSEFGWSDVFQCLGILKALKEGFESALSKDQLGVLEANVDILGKLSPNHELGLGIDVALSVGNKDVSTLKKDLRLAVATYLVQKYEKFMADHLGKVRISIEDFKRINATTCEVFYKIEGLNDSGMKNGVSNMILSKGNNPVDYHKISPTNHSGSKVFTDLSSGEYMIEFYIHSSKYYFILYDVKYTFNIYELELEHYEIEDSPSYKNGAVNFKLNIFLDGDEAGFKDVQQFGYYIKYANAIDYKEVKHLSSIFELTELTYELSIPRDGFSDETINYTTFEAKPSIDYYIGVYVVLKNGNIVHFDEEAIKGLEYKQKPMIKFTSGEVTGGEIIDESEDGVRYKTYYAFECDIKGCFWLEHIQYTVSQSNFNNYWAASSPDTDGLWKFNGWVEYTNSISINSYYTMYLRNGNIMTSANGLDLSCSSGSGTTNISGGTRGLLNSMIISKKEIIQTNVSLYEIKKLKQ